MLLGFDLDLRRVTVGHANLTRTERVRSRWLFQILARLALARLEGEPWVELADLASLDDCGASTLKSAATKLASLGAGTVAGVDVATLIVPRDGNESRGPYRLGLPVEAVVSPGRNELGTYVATHRRDRAPLDSATSWLDALALPVLPGSATSVLEWADAAMSKRLASGVSIFDLVRELRLEPKDELDALLGSLGDASEPLAASEAILRRAAREERSILRAVAHGVLLVRGAHGPHDALPVLRSLGHDEAPLARMLANAVLLRIVTRRRSGDVRDLIFEIADHERVAHRTEFLARDLGIQRRTYHPLAPAGVASILVDKTPDLGYVGRLLGESIAAGDEELAIRCLRDSIWLGIHYPKQTFTTLRGVRPDLPPHVREALATTLAIIRPRHARLVERYVRDRPELGQLAPERADPEWTSRYGAERGLGERLGRRLLDSQAARVSLATTIGLLHGGTEPAEILERITSRARRVKV